MRTFESRTGAPVHPLHPAAWPSTGELLAPPLRPAATAPVAPLADELRTSEGQVAGRPRPFSTRWPSAARARSASTSLRWALAFYGAFSFIPVAVAATVWWVP